jgi:hypothetical protein
LNQWIHGSFLRFSRYIALWDCGVWKRRRTERGKVLRLIQIPFRSLPIPSENFARRGKKNAGSVSVLTVTSVNRWFQFHKRRQHFIGTHDEAAFRRRDVRLQSRSFAPLDVLASDTSVRKSRPPERARS